MQKATFEKNKYGNNEVLAGDGFYISFNRNPCGGIGFFGSDHGGSETALVRPGDPKKFRILNGDFRDKYLTAFPEGWEACLAVYEKFKKEHDSFWTTGNL